MNIRIGTRGSKLALWQAYYVADLLKKGNIETEIVIIETKGDQILDRSLSKIGSKGVFTAELEEQLRAKAIDIAVHSAKDVQSELEDDLTLIAFTERELTHDVVLSFDKKLRLENLNSTHKVGTSSTRRVAMLKHFLPNVITADVRGNLQTRLKKLENGDYNALILAYAGVKRMGYENMIVEELANAQFTPAVGQGSVALEACRDLTKDKWLIIRDLVNHPASETCLLAERAFLKKLQGGCSVPVFGLAEWEGDNLTFNGGIISLDGQQLLRERMSQSAQNPENLGVMVAENLLAKGADEILRVIKSELKK
jgi:hydroxymethylbilane synthase